MMVDLIDLSDSDAVLNKKFTWSIHVFRPTEMLIQLKFEKPINISSSNLDKVVVTFTDTSILFDENGSNLESGLELWKFVPSQFSS